MTNTVIPTVENPLPVGSMHAKGIVIYVSHRIYKKNEHARNKLIKSPPKHNVMG